MKAEIRSETAIVLGSTAFQEDSAIVTLAGENGVFSLLCHGIYKPKSQFKPLLIVGSLLTVEFKTGTKGPNIASSVLVLHDSSRLFQDYSKSCLMMYLQELCLALFKYGDSFPFQETKILLNALEQGGDTLSIAVLFLATFHKQLGLGINVEGCIHCGRTQNIIAYSLRDGGFICHDCFGQYHLDKTNDMNLFVMKYAFSPLSESILQKKVPKSNGLYVFNDLHENLVDYFDLKPIKSYSLFLQSLD